MARHRSNVEQPGPHASSDGFRPDVEGLRAVAVLLVLAFHAGLPFVPGGYAGVDVFFVISGFLITGLLVREVERFGRIDLGRFYARRAKRLLPAAVLVLVVTAVLTRLFVPVIRWAEIAGDLIASAFYVVNWRLADRAVDYLAEDSVASPVQHFWSLAVEEQFYVVWPLLIVLGAFLVHRHRLRVRPVLGLLLVLVVLASFSWSLHLTSTDQATAYFVTTTRLWELGVGGLVAITAPAWRRLRPGWGTALAWAGLLALVVAGGVLGSRTAWPGSAALLPTLGTAAAIAGGFTARSGGPVRLLGSRPMVRVGAWSYSLYLWHWPLLVVAAAIWGELSVPAGVGVVAVSVVPAVLGYRLVEDPVRRAAVLSRLPRLALGVGVACSIAGLVAGLALQRSFDAQIEAPSDAGTTAAGADQLVGQPGDDPAEPGQTTPTQTTGPQSTGGQTPGQQTPGQQTPGQQTAPPADPWAAGPDVSRLDLTPDSITPDPLLATQDLPQVHLRGCVGALYSSEVKRCSGGDPDGTVSVAVVGDSKIAQWGDVLDRIGTDEGWKVTYYLRSSCPFADAVVVNDDVADKACRTWGQNVLDQFDGAQKPDVVLTSAVKNKALDDDGQESVAAMAAGHAAMWQDLAAEGIPVVVLSDTPQPGGLDVYACVAEHRDDVGECTFTTNDGSGTEPLSEAVAQVPGTGFVDMNDWICPLEQCPPVIGDVLVYRQGSHITNTYALSLLKPLQARLVPVVAAAVG